MDEPRKVKQDPRDPRDLRDQRGPRQSTVYHGRPKWWWRFAPRPNRKWRPRHMPHPDAENGPAGCLKRGVRSTGGLVWVIEEGGEEGDAWMTYLQAYQWRTRATSGWRRWRRRRHQKSAELLISVQPDAENITVERVTERRGSCRGAVGDDEARLGTLASSLFSRACSRIL